MKQRTLLYDIDDNELLLFRAQEVLRCDDCGIELYAAHEFCIDDVFLKTEDGCFSESICYCLLCARKRDEPVESVI